MAVASTNRNKSQLREGEITCTIMGHMVNSGKIKFPTELIPSVQQQTHVALTNLFPPFNRNTHLHCKLHHWTICALCLCGSSASDLRTSFWNSPSSHSHISVCSGRNPRSIKSLGQAHIFCSSWHLFTSVSASVRAVQGDVLCACLCPPTSSL